MSTLAEYTCQESHLARCYHRAIIEHYAANCQIARMLARKECRACGCGALDRAVGEGEVADGKSLGVAEYRRAFDGYALDALAITIDLGIVEESHRRHWYSVEESEIDVVADTNLRVINPFNGWFVEEQPNHFVLIVDDEAVAIGGRWAHCVELLDVEIVDLALERNKRARSAFVEGYIRKFTDNARLDGCRCRCVESCAHRLSVGGVELGDTHSEVATRQRHEELLALGCRERQSFAKGVLEGRACVVGCRECARSEVHCKVAHNSTRARLDYDLRECSSLACTLDAEAQYSAQVFEGDVACCRLHICVHRCCSALECPLGVVLYLGKCHPITL